MSSSESQGPPDAFGPGPLSRVPLHLPRYELREKLGEGATAVVYAAWDRELQRSVAIKVLRETMGMSEIARERFRREAQAAAGLSHPNLVTVYDAGSVDGQAYLVMEQVQGRSLDDVLRGGRYDLRDAARILEKAARGVAAAHEKGVVHRDLKPANILLSTSGDPKVGDFGMAHLMDSRMELTRSGMPLGTPLYMAPEQVHGRNRDMTPRTDVYGLGAILYQMLTGQPPHLDETLVGLYAKIAQEEPTPPRKINPSVPPELEAIALKALDKEPGRRYAAAGGFADDLARYLEGKPIEARPASAVSRTWRRVVRHRTALAAAAAALLAVAGVALWGQARARSLELERQREREAADAKLRASQSSQEASRRREDSLKRLSNLWGRMVAVREWRQQPSRKSAEIREELHALLREVVAYIDEFPTFPQGYYLRARIHHSSGDLKSAEADLRRALDRAPDFGPGFSLLARVKMDDYTYRIYAWSTTERMARRKAYEPVLREAEEALAKGGRSAGRAEWERWGLSWTREDIIHDVLLTALKEWYVDQKKEEARARILKAQTESAAAEYCDFLGNWAGDALKAVEWMNQAIAIAPHWSRPYLDRGIVRSVMGEREKAIEDFTRAIEIDPKLAMAYNNRGFQRIHLNDPEAALEDCNRALEIDPNLSGALMHRGEAHRMLRKFREAVDDCTRAIEISPAEPVAWQVRGLARLDLGEPAWAAQDFDHAIQLHPEEPANYVGRAQAYTAMKEFARAREDCKKALELAPPAWVGRAVAQALLAQLQGK